MNNGLTSAVIEVLVVAASTLATTDRERTFAVWFASRDQSVFGIGMVGFDVRQMPWAPATFAADRSFVLEAIDAAKAGTGWERLGFNPREDWVRNALDGFRRLVAAFRVEDAETEAKRVWPWLAPPEVLEQCPRHGVYLHGEGCILCNAGLQ
jgi:hypothetical protein